MLTCILSSTDKETFHLFSQIWFYVLESLRNRKIIYPISTKEMAKEIVKQIDICSYYKLTNYTIVTSKLFWPFTLLMGSYTTTKNGFVRKCNIPLKYDYRTIMKTRLITHMWKGSHNNLPTKLYSLTGHKLTDPDILRQTVFLKQDSAFLGVRQKDTFQEPKMWYKIFNRHYLKCYLKPKHKFTY